MFPPAGTPLPRYPPVVLSMFLKTKEFFGSIQARRLIFQVLDLKSLKRKDFCLFNLPGFPAGKSVFSGSENQFSELPEINCKTARRTVSYFETEGANRAFIQCVNRWPLSARSVRKRRAPPSPPVGVLSVMHPL